MSRFAAVLLLAASPAAAGGFAAPMVVPPPAAPAIVPPAAAADWTGFYLGAQAGQATFTLNNETGDVTSTTEGTTDGPFVGLHAGYQRDLGRLVVGAELDYDRLDLTYSAEDDGEVYDIYTLESVARAKLRLGFDAGRVLPYVTAGLARATFQAGTTYEDVLADPIDGRFVGVGVAARLGDHLMLSAEALRHDFERRDVGVNDQSAVVDLDTLSLRASWRF